MIQTKTTIKLTNQPKKGVLPKLEIRRRNGKRNAPRKTPIKISRYHGRIRPGQWPRALRNTACLQPKLPVEDRLVKGLPNSPIQQPVALLAQLAVQLAGPGMVLAEPLVVQLELQLVVQLAALLAGQLLAVPLAGLVAQLRHAELELALAELQLVLSPERPRRSALCL